MTKTAKCTYFPSVFATFVKFPGYFEESCSILLQKYFKFDPDDSETNQSRICGKGVGLGVLSSDSLQAQLYNFTEIAHIDHTIK